MQRPKYILGTHDNHAQTIDLKTRLVSYLAHSIGVVVVAVAVSVAVAVAVVFWLSLGFLVYQH